MRRKNLILLFFLVLGSMFVQGQTTDTTSVLDTIPPPADSTLVFSATDSLDALQDSLGLNAPLNRPNVKFSPGAPSTEIVYGAEDKKWFDLDSNLVHLYGNAFVDYGTLQLKAGYIIFDFKNNIATAEGIIDSTGEESQRPLFIDGESEFTYNKLRYNFATKKGFVYNTYTKEGDLFVQGTQDEIHQCGFGYDHGI